MTISPDWPNEKRFTDSVRLAARQLGWMEYHTYRSTRSTPGFPDLVLIKPPRLIWAELKMPRGRITEPQRHWFRSLVLSGQECYIWRPSDWDEILRILQRDP